LPLDRRLLFL